MKFHHLQQIKIHRLTIRQTRHTMTRKINIDKAKCESTANRSERNN